MPAPSLVQVTPGVVLEQASPGKMPDWMHWHVRALCWHASGAGTQMYVSCRPAPPSCGTFGAWSAQYSLGRHRIAPHEKGPPSPEARASAATSGPASAAPHTE